LKLNFNNLNFLILLINYKHKLNTKEMETLMARFKASRNSGRKSSFEDSYSNNENQNKMNENSNTKKDKNTDSFSSDDEKPK